MNWKENDLKVVEMREKVINLTDEFNKNNGLEIKNYHKKLRAFLNNRLKKMSKLVLAEHLFISLSALKIPNRNI